MMEPISLKITNPDKHLNATAEVGRNYSDIEKQKIAKASRDFESLLTSMMIKSMNKTTGGMFGDSSFGGDVMDTVFETEIAKKFSENRGLGIANSLYKKVTGEDITASGFKLQSDSRMKFQKNEKELKVENINAAPASTKRVPATNSLKKLNKYEPIIKKVSEKFRLNKNLIRSVILTESAANEKAVSSAGAKGLMQLMDSTATDMGVKNSFNPEENIAGGSKYLADMLRRYSGDLDKSLAAYNAGPGNVDKYDGIPPFDETVDYIKRIKEYLTYFEG